MACELTCCCSTTGCGPGMYGQYLFSRVWINRGNIPARRQLNRDKCLFPFPRLRLRIWSSKTGSAVPSCAACSLSMLRLNLSLTHRISPDFRDNTHIIYKPPLGFSPKFIGSRNCVYRWRSLSRVHWHRASIPQGSSRNECCLFRLYYGPIFCAPLFFHPQGENRGGGAGGSNRRRASLVALL